MSRELLARLEGSAIGSGVFPDYDAQSAPLYFLAKNLLFGQGKVSPFPGGVSFFPTGTTAQILGIEQVNIDGRRGVVFGTPTEIRLWFEEDEGTTVAGSGFSLEPQAGDVWRFIQWQQDLYAIASSKLFRKQPNDPVFLEVEDFTSMYTTGREIVRWRQYLFAFGLAGDFAANVTWCDTNAPTTWTPSATNSAGSTAIRNLEGGLRAGKMLGDVLVVASGDSLHAVVFIGGRRVFSVESLFTGVGAWSKYSMTVAKNRLYGWGPKGLWASDGTSYDYIQTPAVKQFILRDFNEAAANRVLVYHDNRLECVLFFYPSKNSMVPNKGVAYNYRMGTWSPLEILRLCASDTGLFPFPVVGTPNGRVLKQSEFDAAENPGLNINIQFYDEAETYVSGWGELGYGELGWGGSHESG